MLGLGLGRVAGLGGSVGKVTDYQTRDPGFDSPGTHSRVQRFISRACRVRRHGVDLKLCLCAVS